MLKSPLDSDIPRLRWSTVLRKFDVFHEIKLQRIIQRTCVIYDVDMLKWNGLICNAGEGSFEAIDIPLAFDVAWND
jgi:hypothetical protein